MIVINSFNKGVAVNKYEKKAIDSLEKLDIILPQEFKNKINSLDEETRDYFDIKKHFLNKEYYELETACEMSLGALHYNQMITDDIIDTFFKLMISSAALISEKDEDEAKQIFAEKIEKSIN